MANHLKIENIEELEESSQEFEDVPETPPEKLLSKPVRYHPCKEWKYWSQNIADFLRHGDAPFCYSIFIRNEELGPDFWGTLLGYQNNGYLSPLVRFLR